MSAEFTIQALNKNDEVPLHLIYLADESKEAIEDYLKRGTCYIGKIDDEIIGEYILLPTRPFTVELINVAVDEKYQNQGYGKKLVYHAIETAKAGNYKVLEVGTGNCGISQLALYQKCGFNIYDVDVDFFKKHYDHAMYENGIQLLHMIRMKMDLNPSYPSKSI